MMRRIKVCAGIGDNIWLLQKLYNTGERFVFELPDGMPQRGKQIFDLLPQVAADALYVPGLSYKKLSTFNIENTHKEWRLIKAESFYLSINTHLENGKRIEAFLPDVPVTYNLPWIVDKESLPECDKIFAADKRYIGIYGSSYSTVRSWGFWEDDKWFKLIEMVHKHNPEYVFVIIGADWDMDLNTRLCARLDAAGIDYINTTGRSLGFVVEVMKRLKYFYAFPSGLPILATTVGCPVTMFYPKHLIKMMNAWADPALIESGRYKGCQFCEPEKIFEWTVENKMI